MDQDFKGKHVDRMATRVDEGGACRMSVSMSGGLGVAGLSGDGEHHVVKGVRPRRGGGVYTFS